MPPDVPEAPKNATGPAEGRLDGAAFERLFTHTSALLAILDREARFLAVNPACARVLGRQPEELVGQSLLDDVAANDPSAATPGATAARGWDEGYLELLARHRHHDGSWRWMLWSGSAQGDHWYASAKDVTEWIRLEHRAGRDPLTALPTREAFTAEVTQALDRHTRSGLHLGVLYVDIDGFRQLNDSIGHEAGDRLLVQVTRRLRETVRAGDIVARLGNNAFGILLEMLDSDHEAVTIGRAVAATFSEPFELAGDAVAVSASVGLATAHDSRRGADRVIHEADIAMHRAKVAGRERFAIFDAGLRAEVDRRLTLERALRGALAAGEFHVHYQPVVALQDGALVACEALLRWHHPGWEAVAPGEFIPLAEENGLIVPLGAWVLETALHQLAGWRAQGAELTMSVNVSPRQLARDGLVSTVTGLLAQTGVPPQAVCLEITETAVLAEPIRAATHLAQLRAAGVRVAFDDFGTGFSSLRHLSQLPVDVIKLDRTFVTALSGRQARRSRAVLMAVTTAARELGIGVIAEGVEDARQLDELRRAGCAYCQGYLFSPAVPAEQIRLSGYELPAPPPGRIATSRAAAAPRARQRTPH